jgi:hypothetical protein
MGDDGFGGFGLCSLFGDGIWDVGVRASLLLS